MLSLFAGYALCRIIFIAFYPHLFSPLGFTDWIRFCWMSLRYDASAIFSINLIFIVLLLIPFPKGRYFFTSVKVFFVLVNWFFLALNLADIPYFEFNTRRTSYDVLVFLFEDIGRQLPQLLLHFWPWTLVGIAGIWPMWKTFAPHPAKQKPDYLTSLLALIFWTALSIGLIRNSLTLKPLLPGEAFLSNHPASGHGILNTPFVIFKTTEEVSLPDSKWLTEERIGQIVRPRKITKPSGLLKGYNVVILILESFSTEYTGLEGNPVSYSPYLDSLAKANLWFPHHFASGRTSRDAVPSVLGSIPSWMPETFAHSKYISARIEGLGTTLKEKGYQTRFFHGGRNGTMSFDIASSITGFSQYFGLNEYPGPPEDNDGHWGIFDGPMLKFMADKSGEASGPFASCIFTLSSHQPYTIPRHLKGKFPKGPLEIHEAIGYTDYALRQFFSYARNKPWYNKTLFVITADHTQLNHDPRYADIRGRFDVPLVFFTPARKLEADTSRFVQHLDILPSVLDLLGVEPHLRNPLGTSVFSEASRGFPVVYQDDEFIMFHPSGMLTWRGMAADKDWNWIPESGSSEPANLREEMMARLQYFRQGLIRNRLFQH
jgi:uncharacterized sulfatase